MLHIILNKAKPFISFSQNHQTKWNHYQNYLRISIILLLLALATCAKSMSYHIYGHHRSIGWKMISNRYFPFPQHSSNTLKVCSNILQYKQIKTNTFFEKLDPSFNIASPFFTQALHKNEPSFLYYLYVFPFSMKTIQVKQNPWLIWPCCS